jgi:hypothetical protein
MSLAPDPADADRFRELTTARRGGYGEILFEGQYYTKFEWIMRSAAKGADLAYQESRVLYEEIMRLRAEVEELRNPGMTPIV